MTTVCRVLPMCQTLHEAVLTNYLYSSHIYCMYYYHHFVDDEIKAQKCKSTCSKVTQERSGRTKIQTHVCADQSSYSLYQ